jgi:metalloendopeptidase OMA1, mitochondrial
MTDTFRPALRARPLRAARLPALALVVALAGWGCQPPLPPGGGGGGGGEGPGHRAQTLGLTPEQEYSLGEQAYKEILSKAQVLPQGAPEVRRVRRVGERIAKAAAIKPLQKEINLHLQGYRFDWEFNVLRDKQVNAFCLPGGKVGVFTGLLQLTGDNDDELATVLSHEVAHALAHHSNERITRENMRKRAVEAAAGSMGRMGENERRVLIGLLSGGTQLQSLAYDRKQESEADHIGVFLMTFAGYNPDEALRFWLKMEELSARRGHPPAILSTHPSDAKRIEQLREWIPRAKAGKKAFDEGRVAR